MMHNDTQRIHPAPAVIVPQDAAHHVEVNGHLAAVEHSNATLSRHGCAAVALPSAPEAPQDGPFFATKDTFLQAVFDNWIYFARVLLAKYRWLFAWERETGTEAPLGTGWYVPLQVPKAKRKFEVTLGSCDVQDILLDAIERCLNSQNCWYYKSYVPMYQGKFVKFTTWFLYPLHSCVGARVKARKCRRRYEQPQAEPAATPGAVDLFLTQNVPALLDDSPTGVMYTADAIMAHYGSLGESLGFPSHAHQPRRQHPDHHQETGEDSIVDVQLSMEYLATYLTTEERTILHQYLRFGSASRAFAQAIGYEYNQARNKVSSITKKLQKKLIKVQT
jgi:hypothetical protein